MIHVILLNKMYFPSYAPKQHNPFYYYYNWYSDYNYFVVSEVKYKFKLINLGPKNLLLRLKKLSDEVHNFIKHCDIIL